MTRWDGERRLEAASYDAQWDRLAATGADPHGEAAFVMAYAPGSVLDAGCGTGRVAIELAGCGVDVVGVDLDASFIEAARAKAPTIAWCHADLAAVDIGRTFDVVVLAGNVMIFLAPGSEGAVLSNLGRHLAAGGRLVAGFQLGADRLSLATFDTLAEQTGLVVVERFATWERGPYQGGDYAVSVLAADSV